MQARHSSSGAVNDASGMIRTIIPHSLVKAILASHNETKSNRCSSMASKQQFVLLFLVKLKYGNRCCQVLYDSYYYSSVLSSASEWPSLPHTMKQRAILASHNETRHSSSGAVNDASGMIRTIIPYSLVKAILASHNETKSNRCSSMASASE